MNRIEEINKSLQQADKLRVEKIHLTRILKELKDNPSSPRPNVVLPSLELDDNSREQLLIQVKICKAISDKPKSNRELINEIASYEQDRTVIRAIKTLGEKGIVCRNANKEVAPGENWDQRPLND